ncbi:MAG: tRNA modification GTPase [Blastocatellia bacterium]|jgi:tRNA modification GTPase|nr:tRNA modification GTPase [Blastocatellia bacterium]
MVPASDTIVALSTPPGRGALGVVRLSGPAALEIATRIVAEESFQPEPGHVTLRNLIKLETGEVLDQALVTYFRAPHSFTGEDLIEFSCHGSPILLELLLEEVLKLDARLATPGEFTLRAVGNGRVNLSQAEAIRDLIEAQTSAAARQASRQLLGEVSQRLQPIKDTLIAVIVPLESSIEFVEDDLPPTATEILKTKLAQLQTDVKKLAETFSAGRVLREGLTVTLIGRPNAGKSSLFNKLLEYERAIVTDIPGTTRDSLTEEISIDGIPVRFTDTAGLRIAGDSIESIGIQRTRQAAADADLTILVVDGSHSIESDDIDLIDEIEGNSTVIALNKSDLQSFVEYEPALRMKAPDAISVSAKTGAGLDALKAAILKPFSANGVVTDGLLITNARHHDLLRRTAVALESSSDSLSRGLSEELVVVGLYDALRLLGEITGETTPDDVLGEIFSTFCIGK